MCTEWHFHYAQSGVVCVHKGRVNLLAEVSLARTGVAPSQRALLNRTGLKVIVTQG